ncbi:MAG: hypothetical protein GY820_45485 [Gammaproteobacteria bacterium]|nr:hypothetical protein [Gammaproteobacteria bacterium]
MGLFQKKETAEGIFVIRNGEGMVENLYSNNVFPAATIVARENAGTANQHRIYLGGTGTGTAFT